MKIETKNEWKPVTISITFETRDELLDYWHRLNVSPASVRRTAEESRVEIPKYLCVTSFVWDEIDRILNS